MKRPLINFWPPSVTTRAWGGRLMFVVRDPAYEERIAAIFASAPFIQDVGYRLRGCGPGWCETELAVQPRHAQQDGFVHAGVQATMADHTAGAAAATLMAADQMVLTVEFKLNLLRTAVCNHLFCRADVLRPGRQIVVAESAVYAVAQAQQKLVAKAMVTLMLRGA